MPTILHGQVMDTCLSIHQNNTMGTLSMGENLQLSLFCGSSGTMTMKAGERGWRGGSQKGYRRS